MRRPPLFSLSIMATLALDVPYPPSVNHYWRRVGPRTLISRAGRAFRDRVCAILAARQVRPLDGPLAMVVEVFPPDHRRRDVDNCLKSLLDALEKAGAYHDDSQIASLTIRKCAVTPGGRATVQIQTVDI